MNVEMHSNARCPLGSGHSRSMFMPGMNRTQRPATLQGKVEKDSTSGKNQSQSSQLQLKRKYRVVYYSTQLRKEALDFKQNEEKAEPWSQASKFSMIVFNDSPGHKTRRRTCGNIVAGLHCGSSGYMRKKLSSLSSATHQRSYRFMRGQILPTSFVVAFVDALLVSVGPLLNFDICILTVPCFQYLCKANGLLALTPYLTHRLKSIINPLNQFCAR